jgi:hypothetical protein
MRGAQEAQPFGHPLDGRVRCRFGAAALALVAEPGSELLQRDTFVFDWPTTLPRPRATTHATPVTCRWRVSRVALYFTTGSVARTERGRTATLPLTPGAVYSRWRAARRRTGSHHKTRTLIAKCAARCVTNRSGGSVRLGVSGVKLRLGRRDSGANCLCTCWRERRLAHGVLALLTAAFGT